jgi:hypothetical protein
MLVLVVVVLVFAWVRKLLVVCDVDVDDDDVEDVDGVIYSEFRSTGERKTRKTKNEGAGKCYSET